MRFVGTGGSLAGKVGRTVREDVDVAELEESEAEDFEAGAVDAAAALGVLAHAARTADEERLRREIRHADGADRDAAAEKRAVKAFWVGIGAILFCIMILSDTWGKCYSNTRLHAKSRFLYGALTIL